MLEHYNYRPEIEALETLKSVLQKYSTEHTSKAGEGIQKKIEEYKKILGSGNMLPNFDAIINQLNQEVFEYINEQDKTK
jgi:prefoldin subunit 5